MWLAVAPAALYTDASWAAPTRQITVSIPFAISAEGLVVVRAGLEVEVSWMPVWGFEETVNVSWGATYGAFAQVLAGRRTLDVALGGRAAFGVGAAQGDWGHSLGLGPVAEGGVVVSPFRPPALRLGLLGEAQGPGPTTHFGRSVDFALGSGPDVAWRFGGGWAVEPVEYVGRPLRVGGRVVLPRAIGRAGPALDAARQEWASVPAFRRLAAELDALGAPDLAARARAAAADEVRHTLAKLDEPALLEVLPVPPVRGGDRDTRLARLAVESLVDGVIGEGAAADRETDETIAREERAHAALAADIVAWARAESRAARTAT